MKRWLNVFLVIIFIINEQSFPLSLLPAPVKEILKTTPKAANDSTQFNNFLEKSKFLKFSPDRWNQMRRAGEERVVVSTAPAISPPPQKEIGFELPYESRLSISGRKFIGLKFAYNHFSNKDKKSGQEFDMNQELQVRIKGKVGRKVDVNVNFDDTTENKRDISVIYKGDPEEIVQEASFGDIDLSLPGSPKFVTYTSNKQLFGIKLKTKFKNFEFTGIGSRTKGITETKIYSGNTQFDKREINDNAYIRRKYYKFALNDDHLSTIVKGSEKIYLDDRNASTYNITTSTRTAVPYGVAGSTYTGSFDLLFSGQDYFIDYTKGVITFRTTLQLNYVLAVDYQYQNTAGDIVWVSSNGANPGTNIFLIKDENESANITKELKNYYNIGATKIVRDNQRGNFIFKVLDLTRKEVSSPHYPDDVEIDFETGIFNFKGFPNNQAFPPTVYNPTPDHQYSISIEFRSRIKIFSLRPNIVLGSERVILDGRVLRRDEDYFIDYDSGLVTFYHEENIREDSRLEITYEYSPFSSQMQQTIVGGRATLSLGPNFSLGSTAILNNPNPPSTVPTIRNAPESSRVVEADLRLNIAPEWSPLKITNLVTEIAQSSFDPNTANKAIIENMESARLEESVPTVKEAWQLSSNPNGMPTRKENVKFENNEIKVVENEDVKVKDINSNAKLENTEETQQVLKVNYQLFSSTQQISTVHVISSAGLDFSKKLFIEGWIYGDGNGETLSIGLGGFNEDADGNGVINTEDLNNNGSLAPGEDIGWEFKATDGSFRIGTGNGRIDTENLGRGLTYDDGMGGKFSTLIDQNETIHSTVDWNGWKFFRIPLNITSSNQDLWKIIRQIRLTISGVNNTGYLKFANLSVVGNKWEEPTIIPAGGGTMTVSAISNEEDAKVGGIFEIGDFTDLHENVSADKTREQALRLKYTNLQTNAIATTKITFTRPQDYSNYRELKFFLLPRDLLGETFFVRLGSETNYFEYAVPLSAGNTKITLDQWSSILASLKDNNKDGLPDSGWTIIGKPKINNIGQIVLGINNTSGAPIGSGEIWVNDIYLNDVIVKTGTALGVSGNWALNLPDWRGVWRDWLSGFASHEEKNRNFRVLDAQITGQDSFSNSGNFNLTLFPWLPINGSLAKITAITPSTQDNPLLSSTIEGRTSNFSQDYTFNLNLNRLPNLSGTYSNNIIDRSDLAKKEIKESYTGKLGYNNPWALDLLPTKYLNFYPLPRTINLSYTRSNYFIRFQDIKKTALGFEDTKEFTNIYSGDLQFQWWEGFNFSPNYSLKVVQEKKILYDTNIDFYPKSLSQTIGANSSWRILKWLNPSFNYKVNLEETYNLTVSTHTTANSKVVVRNLTGNISYAFAPRELLPNFKPTQNLNISSSYNLEDGDSFDNVERDYNFYKLKKNNLGQVLWLRGIPQVNASANRKQFTSKDTLNSTLTWSPFSSFAFANYFSAIKSITTTATYNKIKQHQETNNNSSSQDTLTKRFPDLTFSIGGLEKMFFVPPQLVSDSQLNLTYSKKITENKKISFATERNQGTDLRFNFLKIFIPYGKYNLSKTEEKDSTKEIISKSGLNRNWSVQLGIRLGQWLFTPRYEDSIARSQDFTGNFTQHLISKSPSLQIHSDFNLPSSWRIPFTRKYLHFANRLIFDSTLKYDHKKSKYRDLDNNDTYTLDIKINYNISDNLQLDIGGGGSMVFDKRESIPADKKEDSFSFNISSGLTIKF